MPPPRILTRIAWLAVCSIVLSAVRATAEEPARPLEIDLLHVTAPIHIQPDVHVSRFDRGRKPASVKASISPEVPYTFDALRGKIYDVSAALREIGMTLPKGSRALFGPESQTLYIESTHDDLEIVKAVFYSDPPPIEDTVDVQVIRQSAGHEETLLEAKSVPLVDGRELKFNTNGRESLHLTIQSLGQQISYGEGALHLWVDAKIEAGDNSIAAKSTWLMHHSKPLAAMLGPLTDATVTLIIQTHSRQGRWGDDPESEKENKAAAIREIQKELLSNP